MHLPKECYQLSEAIATHFPQLRRSQQLGLAMWVYGTIKAHSACQNAVIAALLIYGTFDVLRQYLREWLYDGADKARPCASQVEVRVLFGPLISWIMSWWQGRELALAIDPTYLRDEVVCLSVSILYRGCALPVAWKVFPGNRQGVWMRYCLELLRLIRPGIPPQMQVVVMADRGLWSPRLWKRIRDLGWHPILRLKKHDTFQPVGSGRVRASTLVPGPGHAWVGRGTAFAKARLRRRGTLVVVWAPGELDPWVLITDLPEDKIGIWWYSLRFWIELGFRALKGLGWRWDQTKRTNPARVSRHWLVLAVATLWTLAYGTRAEDAECLGVTPSRLISPPSVPIPTPRQISVLARGWSWITSQWLRRSSWRRLWLRPDPWPQPPPDIQILYHSVEPMGA